MREVGCFLLVTWSLAGFLFGQLVKAPSTFVDIPWGASKEEVRATFEARPGVKFQFDAPKLNKTQYMGGNFAGHNVTQWHFWFKAEKFARGMAEFGTATEAFADLKQKLTSQYGRPKVEKNARGARETVWQFPATVEDGPTSIALRMDPDKSVKVIYTNEKLFGAGGAENRGDL